MFEPSPLAVVFPTCIDQVVQLVKLANEQQISLVPSGGRTGLSGGCVATNDEVVVSFDRMNQILDFNPVDRTVRCQPGVVTQQLQQFAVENQLFYPVDFASSGSSQIGGNIATNAGGIRVIRYGMTRDWVAGLKVVTGSGDLLSLNRNLVKNATGYDLRHLFIGSEGTLGFVVEADMKLSSPPSDQQVVVLCLNNLQHLLKVFEQFQKLIELTAFEFFSDVGLSKVIEHSELIRPKEMNSSFYALLEFDSKFEESAVQAISNCLTKEWIEDGIISQSQSQTKSLWQLRERITESLAPYTPYKNDICVKVSEVPGLLKDVEAVVEQHYPGLEVVWFGHIGDGNLHLNILKPNDESLSEFQTRCDAISNQLFDLIRKRGGSISAEHGIGLLKRNHLHFSRTQEEIVLMTAIKKIFDPNDIINPGKLFPTVK